MLGAAFEQPSRDVDLLVGAMSTRWELTRETGRGRLRRTFDTYTETLVDIILAGVQVASGAAVLAPPGKWSRWSSKGDLDEDDSPGRHCSGTPCRR